MSRYFAGCSKLIALSALMLAGIATTQAEQSVPASQSMAAIQPCASGPVDVVESNDLLPRPQVAIDMTVYSLRATSASAGATLDTGARILSGQNATREAVVRELGRHGSLTQVYSTSGVTPDRMTFAVDNTIPRAYVNSATDDGKRIHERTATISIGPRVRFLPTVEGDRVHVDFDLAINTLLSMLRYTGVDATRPMHVDLPTTHWTCIQQNVTLKRDEMLVITGLHSPNDPPDTTLAMTLTVRQL